MTIYLGPLGNLQALPSIGRGIQATITNPAVVHQLAGRGGRVVDHPGTPKRTYALSRSWLTADELGVLEALYLGAYGPGPYVLIEPWRRNYLTPNQSAGTDVLMDTTGFVSAVGVLSSATAQSDHGSRSLGVTTAVAADIMTGSNTFGGAANTNDVPVLPSVSYTAQVRGRLSASTGTVRLDIWWHTAAGVFISAQAGTGTALSTAAFTTVSVTGTAPSNAAYVRLRLTQTAIGGAQTIYLDKWQVEQAASASAWTVGTGVPRVSFDADLGETYNVTPYADATISLIEV